MNTGHPDDDRPLSGKPKPGFSILDRLARVFSAQADHLAASMTPKERGPLVQSAAVHRLLESLGSLGAKESFLDACAVFAQYGMSADDLNKIGHAMVHNRILAFGYGDVIDMGQRMAPPGMGTRKTEPYEGEPS